MYRDDDEDLVALFNKKVKIEVSESDEEDKGDTSYESDESDTSSDDKDEGDTSYKSDESDTSSDDEYEERQRFIEECIAYFRRRAPVAAQMMINRQGKPTAILMQQFLNQVIRQLRIVGPDGNLREAGNDMLANCQNLRGLYQDFPAYFRSL